jgi:hypothetical protein
MIIIKKRKKATPDIDNLRDGYLYISHAIENACICEKIKLIKLGREKTML